MAADSHSHGHDSHSHEANHDCCDHDHGHDHAQKQHSHESEHSHHSEHSHKAGKTAAVLGITARQYKGIGKYLKPWGKPPTGATFWIQVLTAAAVVVISILKGVDSTVALVVSNGPADIQAQQENPMFLAGGIVLFLFAAVFAIGYAITIWTRRAEAAAGEAEAAPPVNEETEEEREAREEREEARAEKRAAKAVRARQLEAEKREYLAQMEEQLSSARQELLMQAEAKGYSAAETSSHMQTLEQQHAKRLALTEELTRLQEKGEREGSTQEEIDGTIQQAIALHKEEEQLDYHQARELISVEQEAVKAGCLAAEVRRRVHARRKWHAEERAARQSHIETMHKLAVDCQAKGMNEEEMNQKAGEEALKFKQGHHAKMKSWKISEKKARTAAAAMQKECADHPESVKCLMGSRVRIDGLKARPELNGRCGDVVAYKQAVAGKPGRLAVSVDGENILLREDALTAVGFDDEPLLTNGISTADDDDDGPPPLE